MKNNHRNQDYETIVLSQDSTVLWIELNRPSAANAINTLMATELSSTFESLQREDTGVRCLVLTGSGDRVFCAGADLKERNGMNNNQWRKQHSIFENVALAMMNCSIPMICAVNGAAFGGGMELVLACDFAWGSSSARFALTEVTLGIMPGLGGTQYLPRAVGPRRAKEIMFSGVPFGADKALEWGLLNRICTPEDLNTQVLKVAKKISENAPIAIREAKQSINFASQPDIKEGYKYELQRYSKTIPTHDRAEGISAYNERRKAIFKGK